MPPREPLYNFRMPGLAVRRGVLQCVHAPQCPATARKDPRAPSAAGVGLAAQATPGGSGCTLEGRNWVCHLPELAAALAASHTALTISDPSDRAADATLRSLAQALGLTAVMPAGDAAPADLTFLLTPAERAGVYVGPHQVELALLRIYRNPPDGSRGPLLWAESYTGDPDMPWPRWSGRCRCSCVNG